MKVLFCMPAYFYEPHFGTFLDEAEKFRREGNEVHILLNNGIFDICTGDSLKEMNGCSFCAKRAKRSINNISRNFHIHEIKSYFDNSIKYNNLNYNSISDIKKIKYKGAEIGFACLSTYISKTRNLDPVITGGTRKDFNYLLLRSRILTDVIDSVLDDIKPEMVYLFNGRFYNSRPVFDLARQRNINTRCMDAIEYADGTLVKQISNNTTLHNIKNYNSQINRSWNLSSVSFNDKKRIANDFFNKKRDGTPNRDVVYTKHQKKGLLPVGFDKNKQNIVIFNSSEDEYAAISDEYDELSLFKTQIEGLEYLFKTFQDNEKIHFYLRIHPNLSGIKYKYHTDLYLFQKKYSNVTVIPPESEVSSYALLDAAEKVIVFRSTMGVEAAYWDKPVILLSGAAYYYLDICYKPRSTSQLRKMIISKLKPKGKDNALKYAYFSMYKDPDKLYKYVDFTFYHFYFLGRRICASNYNKIFGSSRLFSLHQGIMQRFFNHTNKHKMRF